MIEDTENGQMTDAKACPFARAVVIGMGLVGASLAEALRRAWPDLAVCGVDTDERTRRRALEAGMADAMFAPDDAELARVLAEEADLVVLATPVEVDEFYFRLIAETGFAGIVTDTSSTKGRIIQMAGELLALPHNFVPGHPMAGSEQNGIDGARGDLFEGMYWILCPDQDTPPDHFTRLHELIRGVGARVISIAREDHDGAVAVVSHVPHLVASSLVMLANRASDDRQSVMRLAAGGFKDTTRIAAGSPELWAGIFFDNAQAVCSGVDEMRAILESFEQAIRENDRARLEQLLGTASEVRRSLPAAWVPSTDRLLEVRIPMENRNGVVAEVTTIASSVGCNIQSIEIDHVSEDRAFLSMVLTDEGDIGKLSAQLIDAGFSISFSPLQPKEHIHVR